MILTYPVVSVTYGITNIIRIKNNSIFYYAIVLLFII